MKKPLLLLCLIFLINSVYGQAFQDTIPFNNDLGIIVIPISFNGKVKQFAFDTGAGTSVAYGWAKEELETTRKVMTINSSSARKSQMRLYKSGLIELGSRKIRKHRILNTPKNEFFACHNIDGILGVDIIKALNWTIDYKNKILIMYPSNHFPKKVEGMSELNFNFIKSRPYVYLDRKGSRFKFLLDTGAAGSSNISTRQYNLTNLNELPKLSVYSGSFDVNGIFTSYKSTVFKFPQSVSKGAYLSPIIYYDSARSTKIGNRLWKGKELFLSLKNDKLYVSESVVDQVYSGYPCIVMFYDGKMQISGLTEGSELWNMGVRTGDQVKSLNGKVFSDFCSLDTFQRDAMRKEQSLTLELTNGKKVSISKKTGF